MSKKSTFQSRLEEIATMKGYDTQEPQEESARDILRSIIRILVDMFLYPFILMMIWNYIMPDLFGFKTITYWQMFLLDNMIGLVFSPIIRNSIKYK